MKNFLCFIGSIIFGLLLSYLIWLGFHYLIPWVICFKWIWLVVYWAVVSSIIVSFFTFLSGIIIMPLILMITKCAAAKWIPIVTMLIFTFFSVRDVWTLNVAYNFREVIAAISLTLTIISFYVSLIFTLFESEDI